MAEPNLERSNDRSTGNDNAGGGAASLVILPLLAVVSLVSKAWDAITRDGTLAAAGRAGAAELAAATKAFPDSIQVHETGTIWNPTPGEVAASRQYGSHSSYASSQPPHPWPSEVAARNRHQPGNDHGHDNGQDNGHSM
jgi:hypothetical protein